MRVWFGLTLLGVLSAACGRSDTVQRAPGDSGSDSQQGPRITDSALADTLPPPLGQGCPANRPPKTKKELDACTGGLTFDTLSVAGDQQRLLVVDQGGSPCLDNPKRTCRHGPLAMIEPLKNAHKFTKEQLQEGRIIARLFIEGGPEGYPKLALVPGHKTYWWVQRDAAGRGGKSVYVSDSIAEGVLVRSKPRDLQVYDRTEGTFKQALARWLWVADDETAKGTCGSATCK